MTVSRSSLQLSGHWTVLFILVSSIGSPPVLGLVNEKVTAQAATTTGGPSSATTSSDVSGMPSLSFACKPHSEKCLSYCTLCDEYYGEPSMECLSILSDLECFNSFHASMLSLNRSDWCVWTKVNGLYSNLSRCSEEISDCLLIPWPNPLVEQTFVSVHSSYFKDCPSEELTDPPPAIVFALVITPICLIPVMVSLVVLKTKNGDGSS